MRQSAVLTGYDPKPGISIATLAYEYPARYRVREHAHGADQLIYATAGVMEVRSGNHLWLIPSQFALWIPSRTRHAIHMPVAVAMRTLYIRRGLLANLPAHCVVLHVTSLLRELILEAVRLRQLRSRHRMDRAPSDLILAHLEKASSVPSFVIMPKDGHALAVAEAVLSDPAQPRTLTALCSHFGVSVRTVERAFQKQVGTNFESWRRQVRLTKAVELLSTGGSVKEVSFRVGYRQSSTLVQLFRQTFGSTPKAWALALANAAPRHQK